MSRKPRGPLDPFHEKIRKNVKKSSAGQSANKSKITGIFGRMNMEKSSQSMREFEKTMYKLWGMEPKKERNILVDFLSRVTRAKAANSKWHKEIMPLSQMRTKLVTMIEQVESGFGKTKTKLPSNIKPQTEALVAVELESRELMLLRMMAEMEISIMERYGAVDEKNFGHKDQKEAIYHMKKHEAARRVGSERAINEFMADMTKEEKALLVEYAKEFGINIMEGRNGWKIEDWEFRL